MPRKKKPGRPKMTPEQKAAAAAARAAKKAGLAEAQKADSKPIQIQIPGTEAPEVTAGVLISRVTMKLLDVMDRLGSVETQIGQLSYVLQESVTGLNSVNAKVQGTISSLEQRIEQVRAGAQGEISAIKAAMSATKSAAIRQSAAEVGEEVINEKAATVQHRKRGPVSDDFGNLMGEENI